MKKFERFQKFCWKINTTFVHSGENNIFQLSQYLETKYLRVLRTAVHLQKIIISVGKAKMAILSG